MCWRPKIKNSRNLAIGLCYVFKIYAASISLRFFYRVLILTLKKNSYNCSIRISKTIPWKESKRHITSSF